MAAAQQLTPEESTSASALSLIEKHYGSHTRPASEQRVEEIVSERMEPLHNNDPMPRSPVPPWEEEAHDAFVHSPEGEALERERRAWRKREHRRLRKVRDVVRKEMRLAERLQRSRPCLPLPRVRPLLHARARERRTTVRRASCRARSPGSRDGADPEQQLAERLPEIVAAPLSGVVPLSRGAGAAEAEPRPDSAGDAPLVRSERASA